GVWRSLNGGLTWTQALNPGRQGGCLDLKIRTDQATDYILASCGTLQTSPAAAVYLNTDAAGAGIWNIVLTEANMGLTSLAIAPSNQSIMYALASSTASGNYKLGLDAVFKSTDGGQNWNAQVRNTDPTRLNTLLLTNTIEASLVECLLPGPNQFFN